jgi:NitT/TauT family transport system permease protein
VKRSLAGAVAAPLVAFVLITAAAEAALRVLPLDGAHRLLLPAPSEVLAECWLARAELARRAATTGIAALAGFGASVIAGIAAAIALAALPWARRALYPYLVFFQTVPIVALAPILVVLLGAGFRPVAASAFIVSVFPVVANALHGLSSTDPSLVDLFRLYGATPARTFWKLRLPGALPDVITGLRIAAGLAVIGAIVGDFVAGATHWSGGGLGLSMAEGLRLFRTTRVYASVLLACLLGVVLFGLVNATGWLLLRRWHASQRPDA